MKKFAKHISLFSFLFIGIISFEQRSKKIHAQAILIDTHNDFPYTALEKNVSFDQSLKGKTHSDLQRMKEGGTDAQFFSIWCDGEMINPYNYANRQIDSVLAWTNRNPAAMQQAFTADDIVNISSQNKLAVLMGVEGGHMIENDLGKLDAFYKRGVRYMTLTWNNSTDWATSAAYETSPNPSEAVTSDSVRKKGLTGFGKQIVHHMNDIGMMVDLSHVGEQTFWDVINTTSKPVLVSHSCVYTLCPHRRNLKDDQIQAVAKNGGVIQLNFYSGFLNPTFEDRAEVFLAKHKAEIDSMKKIGQDDFMHTFLFEKYNDDAKDLRPPLSLLIDHIDYVVKLVGVDYVGLGSDFDGVNSLPAGLEGVEDFPKITAELLKRGYSKKEIKKILGGNLLRVFKANQ